MAATGDFIGTFHFGNVLARCFAHLQHFGSGFERVGDGGTVIIGGFALSVLIGSQNKTAANGIVGLGQDHIALRICRVQDHTVGVTCERWAIIKEQIVFGRKFERWEAFRTDRVGFADCFKRGFGLFVIIGFGDKACEAQNGRAICRVAYACEGEGAV